MKIIYFFKTTVILTFLAPFLVSCGDDDDIKVSALTLIEAVYSDNKMRISLKDNVTLQLTPFIMPQNATNQKVAYSNLDSGVLTVSQTGLITPTAVGTDTLTVSATDGSGVHTSYIVHITDHRVKATGITVTAQASNMNLRIGESFDLSAHITISPQDTWDKSVTYTSSNQAIVAVSTAGIVTPIAVGAATITITTADGSNISRTCNVNVQE